MLEIERYSLPNGLSVCLNRDQTAPLVAVNLWHHVGSKDEVPGKTGFAHLFEHMLFSGSMHVGNNEHFRYIQSVGGNLNGSTFFDRTNYYETLPSHYLALALWLESDRMGWFVPALTQEKLDVQKNVVKEERRLRYDNAPYGTWLEELLALAYRQDFPYSWPTIGSMDDIEAATLDDVREFFLEWYGPQNAVLTIAGDFDSGEARELVEAYFAEIPGRKSPSRHSFDSTRGEPDARKVIRANVHSPKLFRLYHLPPMGDAGWIGAEFLATLLSSGKSSRLVRSLTLESQLAQDIGLFVLPTEMTGMLLLTSTPRDGVTLDELEDAIDEELRRVGDGISRDEERRVQSQLRVDHARQIESLESRADAIGLMQTFFGDPDLINLWPERYAALKADELIGLSERVFSPGNRVTVGFEPEQKR